MSGRQLHRMATFALSLAMAVIGVALIVQGFTASGGVSASKLLLGVLFVAAGGARSYLEVRKGRRS